MLWERGLKECPLLGGCPLLGEYSPVHVYFPVGLIGERNVVKRTLIMGSVGTT